MQRTLRRHQIGVVLWCIIAASCSPGSSNEAGSVTVFAAASLTDVFTALATDMHNAGGPEITLSFAGSSTLATQVIEGAPADVFASANAEQMDRVARALAHVGEPTVFARNRLVIAVEAGNPEGIERVEDLARPELLVALAAPEVPAGNYAQLMLDAAKVAVTPATYEADVRAVLTKVELGEVDAGIVYASDVADARDVAAIDIPDAVNQVADYPIVAVDRDNAAASAFIDFVMSPAGQERLADFGFDLP